MKFIKKILNRKKSDLNKDGRRPLEREDTVETLEIFTTNSPDSSSSNNKEQQNVEQPQSNEPAPAIVEQDEDGEDASGSDPCSKALSPEENASDEAEGEDEDQDLVFAELYPEAASGEFTATLVTPPAPQPVSPSSTPPSANKPRTLRRSSLKAGTSEGVEQYIAHPVVAVPTEQAPKTPPPPPPPTKNGRRRRRSSIGYDAPYNPTEVVVTPEDAAPPAGQKQQRRRRRASIAGSTSVGVSGAGSNGSTCTTASFAAAAAPVSAADAERLEAERQETQRLLAKIRTYDDMLAGVRPMEQTSS